MMATITVEDTDLRSALRQFHARLETALSLAARHNWSTQEALAALRDEWEQETLDNALELARTIEELLLAAMSDGELDADERQEIIEVVDGFARLLRALREYDAHENLQHDQAAIANRASRGHLRSAIGPVSDNLRTLNHRRGGRRQTLAGLKAN